MKTIRNMHSIFTNSVPDILHGYDQVVNVLYFPLTRTKL